MSRRLPSWALPLLLAVLAAAWPAFGLSAAGQNQVISVALIAMVTSGFNLSFGYGGELSLGQVALYAVGAYVGGVLAVHGVDLSIALLAAGAAGALVAFVVSIPALRLGGWGLAMVSFLLIIMIPDITEMFAQTTGGLNGLVGIPPPQLFGRELSLAQFYVTVIVVAAVWLLVMRNLVVTRHGDALRVLRESPVLATSLGMNTTRIKFVTYSLGGVSAGLAGCLLASQQLFLTPDLFDINLVIAVIAASVLGGSESIYGAVAGAAIIELLPLHVTVFHDYSLIAYGALLVIFGVFLRGGIARLGHAVLRRLPLPAATPTPVAPPEAGHFTDRGLTLSVESVSKRFGGALVLDDISLTARPGRVTGLIGANGSGKTTLLNLICGFYRPTAGTVSLDGRPITGAAPFRVARRGVARTFQTPLIPASMTSLQVVAAARFAGHYVGVASTVLRLPRFRRRRTEDMARAMQALDLLGIADLASQPASALSLGNRRLVEVARAVCASPAVILLDEPASGLDEREVTDLETAIHRIRDNGTTVILVEHNFRLICEVSDDIHVLELGRVIASGDPDAIRANAAVARSYLGEEFEDTRTDDSTQVTT